jgi:hypothetical protein
MTGGWRKLHNEELHNLYSSPSVVRIIKSRRMRLVGYIARMGRREMVEKPDGRRPLERAIRRWLDNIKMDIREIGWDVMDWIDLTQDRDE